MKKSTSLGWGSLKVGALLMIAIAFSMWASLTGGGTSIFDSKGKFVCYFTNVNGLIKGSPVWMSGVEVGNVRSVKFVHLDSVRQVEVTCRVTRDLWPLLTDEARVQLGTIGFLGDKYIEILPGKPGTPSGRIIEEWDTIPTVDVGSAEAMFKAGEEAIHEAGDIAHNLNSVLARMDSGHGTLGRLSTDEALYVKMAELMTDLTKLSASLNSNQERIVSSLERTSNAVADLTEKVDSNTGTIGKMIGDPQLYDNLAATSARLDTVMMKIQTAEGSLGLFVSDTAFYTETVNLLTRVNNLVTDIEQNPRKYLKFSVF